MSILSPVFSALSDPIRLGLLERLMREGECAAGALARGTGVSAPAVSRHLKILREAGLVCQRVHGTRRLYSLNPDGLQPLAHWVDDRRAFWEGSLSRLDRAVSHLAEDRDG